MRSQSDAHPDADRVPGEPVPAESDVLDREARDPAATDWEAAEVTDWEADDWEAADAEPGWADEEPADTDTDIDSDTRRATSGEAITPTQRAAPPQPALTPREVEMLAFERQWWRHAGAKEQAIRDEFDLSATRYYQLLNGLLDNPLALAHDPVLIGRLRRIRTNRARSRGGHGRP